jgi:hypothetical protein
VGGEGRLVALRNFANSPNKVTEAAWQYHRLLQVPVHDNGFIRALY